MYISTLSLGKILIYTLAIEISGTTFTLVTDTIKLGVLLLRIAS